MNVAITELMGWLRAVDEQGKLIWSEKLTSRERESASQAADRFISSPDARQALVSMKYQARQKDGKPYREWTIALLGVNIGAWMPRDELRGFRWLAGKMLHHGPLSAVELNSWRAGEPPRWKWRSTDDIFPPSRREQQATQRQAYDREIAGRDVLGGLRFNELAAGVERLFVPFLP